LGELVGHIELDRKWKGMGVLVGRYRGEGKIGRFGRVSGKI
jgi:hypothetical protein